MLLELSRGLVWERGDHPLPRKTYQVTSSSRYLKQRLTKTVLFGREEEEKLNQLRSKGFSSLAYYLCNSA